VKLNLCCRAAAIFFLTTALGLDAARGQADDAAALTSAPATQASVPPARIDALIKQLNSDEWRDRETAQHELVAIGAPALDALRRTAESDEMDPEVRSRAAAAMAAIHAQNLDGPTLLSMHYHDVGAPQVLDAIAEQAHVRFNTDVFPIAPTRTITVDADGLPFWDVMEQVCTQLGVCPMPEGGGQSLRLQPMPQNWLTQAPHRVVGPFVVSVTEVHRFRTVDLTGMRGTDERFGLQVMVNAEPKVMVAQMSGMEVTEAVDDAGHSLLPVARPGRGVPGMFFRGNVRAGQQIDVPLQYPAADAGKKIARLRGDVKVAVGQNVERFQIDDPLGAMKVSHALPGRGIEVQITKMSDDAFTVKVTLKRGNLPQEQWMAMTNRAFDIALEDADGHRMTTNGWGGGGGGDEFNFTGQFTRNLMRVNGGRPQKTGQPVRLVWDVPTKVKNITVPVEFKDLPMP